MDENKKHDQPDVQQSIARQPDKKQDKKNKKSKKANKGQDNY